MDQICLVVPVQSGKGEDAREFMDELEQSRMAEYGQKHLDLLELLGQPIGQRAGPVRRVVVDHEQVILAT